MNFPFFIATQVSRNSQRSFSRLIIRIAVLAVALSITVMIITAATVRGFKNQISQKIFGLWGQIHISDASINQNLETRPISIRQTFYPFHATHQRITYTEEQSSVSGGTKFVEKRTLGGIHHIQAFATIPGIIKSQSEIEGILLKSVGSDFDWDFLQSCLVSGRLVVLNDSFPSREILISQITADRLKTKCGDKFVVHFLKNGEQVKRLFEVVGIYKTGLEEYDRKIAFADITMIQQLLGWEKDEVSGFEVFLDNPSDLGPMTEYVYSEVIPNNLYAMSIREKFPSIFDWLDLQDINEYVIICLMGLVAIINMITALLILILERTEMIGILKSLGARNWEIRKIFLIQAAWIVGVGLFWGNLIGIGFSLLQQHFKMVKLSEADYYLSYVPIELDLTTIALLNVATLLTVVLFLIIPSILVTKISPVSAIRFK
ncbi:MAG: ABC transporter permease [Saprospiraceae bacterium]